MNQGKYEYHSRSPEEWEKVDDEKSRRHSPPHMNKRGKLILFFNILLVVVIVFVYFVTQKQRNVLSESLKTIGNFQIYISASKSEFLSGEPFEFKIYATNISNKDEKFFIYSFNVRISSDSSSDIYNFHFDKTINSNIKAKNSVLIYDLKHEIELASLPSGDYHVNVLMNFNGKAVHLSKEFVYVSNVQAVLESGQDFFKVNEAGTFKLYVKNNTPQSLNIKSESVRFSLYNEKLKKMYTKDFSIPSQIYLSPSESKLLYTYNMSPIKETGKYYLHTDIIANKELSATSTFFVINPSKIGEISELKLNSDIPMIVNQGEPVNFSLWLINTALKKKFVVLDSITVTIKNGSTELYRFSDISPHNVIIPSGGTRLLVDSKSWKTITFPSTGTYSFKAIIKIKGKYLEYTRKVKSL